MFDPTLPQEGTPLDAVQMRSQLNGLKAIIDAIFSITAAQVDGVTTLPPGSAATVSVSVTGNTLHLTFGIPQGAAGPMGDVGPMGEVSQAQLNNAIGGTSNNTNGVNMLNQSADSIYNQSQMQDVINKLDEFINTARR